VIARDRPGTKALLAIPVAVAVLYLALLSFSVLMRVRWVSDKTRQASKRANRWARQVAGTRPGSLYFNLAALHHVGRRSGREYVTPLSAYPLGKCTLTWKGHEYALERPERIPLSDALKAYPPLVRPFIFAPGMNEFLWLHRSEANSQQGQALTRLP
jgi:hypothetical protein